MSRFLLALLMLLVAASSGYGADILFVVTNSSSLTTEESARKTSFEGWGHTVTLINEGDSQADFDTALASVDVAYVSFNRNFTTLGYKLRTATVGVVSEGDVDYDVSVGFYNGGGLAAGSASSIDIVDNTHPVTASLGSSLTIFTSSGTVSGPNAALGAGVQKLGTRQGDATESLLLSLEAGATLANTYNGNNTASGRRMRLPMGGFSFGSFSSVFEWGDLSADGLQLVSDSIDWAANESGDDLVGHWKLDESSGTTATDSSDNANDGSHIGSASPGAAGPGVSNGVAASFTGSGDRILVPTDTVYDLTEEVTVSAWVNFNQAVADQTYQQSLVSRFSWSDKKGFQLFTDQPNSNSIRFRVLNGGWKDAVWLNPDIEAGGWRHVVGTYDGTTIRLYVDGELKDTETQTNALAAHTGADLSLGANLDGRLADVRIYDRVLDATEIAEMNGLIAHWKLDDVSGNTAIDSSTFGHDATLTGTAGWTAGIDSGAHESDYTDGTDDYFEAPNVAALSDLEATPFTVMAYYKPNSVPTGSGSQNTARHAILMNPEHYLGINYDDQQRFRFDTWLDGSVSIGPATTKTYPPGKFYHVAAVFDHPGGTIKLYVDGVLEETVSFSPGAALETYDAPRWRLGISRPGGSTYRWAADGVIDDARIYGRALSSDEVSVYASTGLVGHWKLDETSGTTAIDSGPDGADGPYRNSVALDQGGPYPGVTAATFDGNDDHVELPAIDAKFQNGLTIAAWIQPDATIASGQFYEIIDISNGSQVDQILLSYNGNAGLQLLLTDTADGSSTRTIEDNKAFKAGQWVHCVATIDSSGYGKIYRNGQVTKSGFFTSLPTSIARSTVTIGKSSFGDHFGGGLYDVRLYNYELTLDEVNTLYGKVGHWNFDEGSGSTAADSTGVASDALFNTGSPTWIKGVRGTALEFDGTNDAQTSSTIEPPSRGAVALWIRSDGTPGTRQRPWGIGGDYEMWQDSDGLMSMDVSTDGYQGGFITTERLDSAGRWYHLVAQYDSDTETYEIYLDGQLHKSGVSTWDIKQQSANYLTFGTRTGSTQRFSGALDDFRIYNRWLSVAEIADLQGLVGWWRMEETSGSAVADSSGAGNHGALAGSATWSADSQEASGSLNLDGVDYVTVPSLVITEAPDGIALAGWAKLTAADSGGAELVSLGNSFVIRLDNRLLNSTHASGYHGTAWTEPGTGRYFQGSGWHHFAASYDASDLSIKLYVDGVMREESTMPAPLVLSSLGTTTRIGTHANGESNRSFTGLVDDIRAYNRAITPEEVRLLYYGEWMSGLRIVTWTEVANP